ncbi:MAG: hypothetical protein HOE92_01275 [Euryarchaeota archaeon]|nr:hypothetical protein [Euryarchaeota archaeon]
MMKQESLDKWFLRQDVIDQLRAEGADTEDDAQLYANRIMELAQLDEAEHKSLKDPFDRSVALVFELVRTEGLNPWSIDLEKFIRLFSKRIRKGSGELDLPSCGRLIRLAWGVLRHQAEDLYGRALLADEEEESDFNFLGGWEVEFDDAEFAFTNNVLTGEADSTLPNLFQERVHRDEGRPVTLGELLGALREACVESEEVRLREEHRKRHAAAVKNAISTVGNKMHDENLEKDLRLCWISFRDALQADGKSSKAPLPLSAVKDAIRLQMITEYGSEPEDIDEQAWVTTLLSSLHLTHLGVIDLWQEDAPDGPIHIRDKHHQLLTFEAVMAICERDANERAKAAEEEMGGTERYRIKQEALVARAMAAKAAEEVELLSRQEAALAAIDAAVANKEEITSAAINQAATDADPIPAAMLDIITDGGVSGE